MPLDTYTKETIEGLQRGDNVVCSGLAKVAYEKFEQPKEQMVSEMAKRTPTHSKYVFVLYFSERKLMEPNLGNEWRYKSTSLCMTSYWEV